MSLEDELFFAAYGFMSFLIQAEDVLIAESCS